MEKIKPKHTFRSYTKPIAIGLTVLLIAWIVKQVASSLSVQIYDLLPRKIWALLFLSTLGICLILMTLLILNKKDKLKPYFGAYWDKKLNPCCPTCKSLLAFLREGRLHCNKCKRPIHLYRDDNSCELTIREARDLIEKTSNS